MDQWDELRQYEQQQRQRRTADTQRIADEQTRKKKEIEYQLSLREQERFATEQRQSEKRRMEKQQAEEKRQHEENVRNALFQQVAKDQMAINQQREDAQRDACKRMAEQQTIKAQGSPIENIFHQAWNETYPYITLVRQHPIGKYFVDFAHVDTKIAIELDGHAFHSSRKDRNRDYTRQQEIEDLGWRFIRIPGSQVFQNIDGCVAVVFRRIQQARLAKHGTVWRG